MSANQRKLSFIEKVFSVRNEGVRKVICILGIRIKFRTLKLVIRELDSRFEMLDQANAELTGRFNNQVKVLEENSRELYVRLENLARTNDELDKQLAKQEQGYKELRTALQKLIESQRKKNSEFDMRLEKNELANKELGDRLDSELEQQEETSSEYGVRLEELAGMSHELSNRLDKQNTELKAGFQKQIERQEQKNTDFDRRLETNEQGNKELRLRLDKERERQEEISSEHGVRLEELAGMSHELSSRLDRQNIELKAGFQKQIERQEQKNTDFDRRLETNEQGNKELRLRLDKEHERQEAISSEHGVRLEELAGMSHELSSRLDRQNTELKAGFQKQIERQEQKNTDFDRRLETNEQGNKELRLRLDKEHERQEAISSEHGIRLEELAGTSYELSSRLDRQNTELKAGLQKHIDDQLKINNELCNRLDNQEQASKELNSRVEKYDQLSNELSDRFEKQEQNYKREINSKYRQLMYRIHEYCPDEKRPLALKDWFYEHTGEPLDLDNPRTYNEKIQWLKLNDSTLVKTRLADKYLVRDWIKGKIGEEYLIPLLGVWDSFDEIDFDKLPDRFVLKCNHGSGYNIIVKNKSKLDKSAVRKQISSWMNEDFAFRNGFELHYSGIPRKILAEKYIDGGGKDIHDYKLWCFGGKVEYIEFLPDGYIGDKSKDAFYSRDWQKQNFVNSYVADSAVLKKPDNLDLLIGLAEKLACGFCHVRVDFYDVDNRIYFAEMTFTSSSGIDVWVPKEKNLELGNMIRLPEQKS